MATKKKVKSAPVRDYTRLLGVQGTYNHKDGKSGCESCGLNLKAHQEVYNRMLEKAKSEAWSKSQVVAFLEGYKG